MELITPVNRNDHIQGSLNRKTTLVEYGDFECPYCGRAYPIVKEIQKIKGNDLGFVFREFPLSQSHLHAEHVAYAAEAAGKQGKFWEMHDMLFEHQDFLEDEDLVSYAQDLKLNIEQFKNDMASEGIKNKVKKDFMDGVRSGVNGTPTFFINGKRFDGPYEVDTLISAIAKEVNANK
jgi:protein-disulfide isomerase